MVYRNKVNCLKQLITVEKIDYEKIGYEVCETSDKYGPVDIFVP